MSKTKIKPGHGSTLKTDCHALDETILGASRQSSDTTGSKNSTVHQLEMARVSVKLSIARGSMRVHLVIKRSRSVECGVSFFF